MLYADQAHGSTAFQGLGVNPRAGTNISEALKIHSVLAGCCALKLVRSSAAFQGLGVNVGAKGFNPNREGLP